MIPRQLTSPPHVWRHKSQLLAPTPDGTRTCGLALDSFSARRTSVAAHTLSTLSHSAGGLGLASAVRVRPAAHWSSLADSLRMVRQRATPGNRRPREEDPEPSQPKARWQQRATDALSDITRALMRSQHGPLASAPLTALLTSKATGLEAQPFLVFLCRRLHLLLLLSMRTCRCGRQLDMLGHHHAACAVAGMLGEKRLSFGGGRCPSVP